jgi:hypothetical protein
MASWFSSRALPFFREREVRTRRRVAVSGVAQWQDRGRSVAGTNWCYDARTATPAAAKHLTPTSRTARLSARQALRRGFMAKKTSKAAAAKKVMAKKATPRKVMAKKTAAKKTAAKKTAARKTAARRSAKPTRKTASSRRPGVTAGLPVVADVRGADLRREVGGVRLEVGRAGLGRVKRMIYPPGFKWSSDIRPHVGTDYCMHAHVGFLVSGRIDVTYADGCVEIYEGPHIVAVAPGHDGHVVGDEPAVLIEFDFESDTLQRFGMPEAHTHGSKG